MTKTAQTLFALWLIIAGSLGSPQPCWAAKPIVDPVITLKDDTELRRPTVKLSDIFTGVPTEIDRDIAQAPAPGKQVVYDSTVLTRIANKYRLDWQPQSYVDHITISSASSRITAEAIREAVIQKVKAANILTLSKHNDLDVAFDNHALQVDLPADRNPDFALNNFEIDPVNRHFHTDLVAETSSGPFSVHISGRALVKRNIPVLAHRLEAGTTIQVSDIDWIAVPEEHANNGVITEAEQLVGREIRRDTDEGEILHVHDVIPPRFVTRGSLVTIKVETPLMVVTTQGKAMQDGAQGDVIRVTNTQSNRLIEGTVTGPSTVTIQTPRIVVGSAE